jgi:histidinol-phosphate/aromatic aminotransferase/cobyric acid decarboxylase-like protein
VLDDVAADLDTVWAYPEEAYEELRQAIADWAGAEPAEVIPGHGIQALTLAVVATFVEPGDAVIVPRPTYGLYTQACAVAGAVVVRVDNAPSLALDL